jgi:hypothetical protein
VIKVGEIKEDKRLNSGKEELGIIHTYTGCKVKKPRKY